MATIHFRTRLAAKPLLLTPDQTTEVAPKVASYGRSKDAEPK
jgi:hypothetical protein